VTDEQEEEEEEPEEEKTGEDGGESKGNDDDMLKVFMSVEEEFVDNSGLAAQIEDVSTEELLQELRAMASAFGIHVAVSEEAA
jgi:hypothetical protein